MAELKFGPGTCKQHREMFVDLLLEHGIRDWVVMDHIRMLFIAETARHYPSEKITSWLWSECVGCDQEEYSIELIHRLATEQLAFLQFEGA
jgi:hypothetical protein